jgi:hypothetical protein
MARDLVLKAVVKLDSRTMEERLIEVFGCFPVSEKAVIRLDGSAEKRRVESDIIYPDLMEERLIEVFGCLPLSDRVIRLNGNTARKRAAQPVVQDELFPHVAGIA